MASKRGCGCSTVFGAVLLIGFIVGALKTHTQTEAPSPTPASTAPSAPIASNSPTPSPVVARATPSPTPTLTPGIVLADLEHRMQEWPEQVSLLKATSFPVVVNGRVAGSAVMPAGTVANLINITGVNAKVSYKGGETSVALADTDVARRIMDHRREVDAQGERDVQRAEAEQKRAEAETQQKAVAAREAARVALSDAAKELIRQGILRVDAQQGRAWIDPWTWISIDAEAKENFTMGLAAYCNPEYPAIDILDKQSGRKLASYGPFQGFKIH